MNVPKDGGKDLGHCSTSSFGFLSMWNQTVKLDSKGCNSKCMCSFVRLAGYSHGRPFVPCAL